jgi:hypothetical protein
VCDCVQGLYLKDGEIVKTELNSPFALIASRAKGSESVSSGGDKGINK